MWNGKPVAFIFPPCLSHANTSRRSQGRGWNASLPRAGRALVGADSLRPCFSCTEIRFFRRRTATNASRQNILSHALLDLPEPRALLVVVNASEQICAAKRPRSRFDIRPGVFFLVLIVSFGAIPIGCAADSIEYERLIKPLFQQRCYPCHSRLKQKAEL